MPRGQKTVTLRATSSDQKLYDDLVRKFRMKYEEINLSDILVFLAQKIVDEADDDLVKAFEEQTFSFTQKRFVTVTREKQENVVCFDEEMEKAKEELMKEING